MRIFLAGASIAVLLFGGLLSFSQQSPASQSPTSPLSVADVEHGLKAGGSNTRMAALVKQYGVDFELTDVIEKQLRAAGATGDLLLEISRSSVAPSSTRSTILPPSVSDQRTEGKRIERAVRTFYNIPVAVNIIFRLGSLPPSGFPNYERLAIYFEENDKKQEVDFLLSKDGNSLIRMVKMDLTKDSYEVRIPLPADVEDKRIEHAVRTFYNIPVGVNIVFSLGSLRPSEFQNYDELAISIEGSGKKQQYNFLLSKDGNSLMRMVKIDLTKDSYEATASATNTPSLPPVETKTSMPCLHDMETSAVGASNRQEAIEHFNKGAQLTNSGHTAGGAKEFELALTADPRKADAYYWRGIGLLADTRAPAQGQKLRFSPETIECFQMYLALEPEGSRVKAAKDILDASGAPYSAPSITQRVAELKSFSNETSLSSASVAYQGSVGTAQPYQASAGPASANSNASTGAGAGGNMSAVRTDDATSGSSGVDAHDCVRRGVTPGQPWPVVALQNACSKAITVSFCWLVDNLPDAEWSCGGAEIGAGGSTSWNNMDTYKLACTEGNPPNERPDPNCSHFRNMIWNAVYTDSKQRPARPNVPKRTIPQSGR